MRIRRDLYNEMVAYAHADPGNEVCGLIHAKDGEAIAIHPIKNVAGEGRTPSPFRYLMDPLQQHKLEVQRDESGETLFAIYHSHIASEARPSRTDERQAFFPPAERPEDYDREPAYPGTFYILISLTQQPAVRAWRVEKRRDPNFGGPHVEEEPIEVY